MCDCRKIIEEKLLTRFVEQNPSASDHYVELKGYGLIFGEVVREVGRMGIELTAKFPLKKGGEKTKKTTQSMIFTFCPFCGVKYD